MERPGACPFYPFPQDKLVAVHRKQTFRKIYSSPYIKLLPTYQVVRLRAYSQHNLVSKAADRADFKELF